MGRLEVLGAFFGFVFSINIAYICIMVLLNGQLILYEPKIGILILEIILGFLGITMNGVILANFCLKRWKKS